MLYLVALPIVVIAVVVRVVSEKYKLDIMLKIANIVIIAGVLFFLYFYAQTPDNQKRFFESGTGRRKKSPAVRKRLPTRSERAG